jgi:hypothetical protein
MTSEVDELVKRRRESLAAFIESNEALLGINQSEVEQIREDSGQDLSDGPFVLTRWVLVTESQSMSDTDEGLVSIVRRPGTTYIDQLGLLKRALDY